MIFAANWKMNKAPNQAKSYCETLLKNPVVVKALADRHEIILFPSTLCLETVANSLKTTGIHFGSQNCYFEAHGAFTGENSPEVVKAIGAQASLLGHSERRTLFSETSDLVSKKVRACHKFGLKPMICIGETLAEREHNQTFSVLEKMLNESLEGLTSEHSFSIAYEPVWAIGTGKVALPEQVAKVHQWLAGYLANRRFSNISLLYGGSVNSKNSKELSRVPFVNGFLVGGAALEVESFASLIGDCI